MVGHPNGQRPRDGADGPSERPGNEREATNADEKQREPEYLQKLGALRAGMGLAGKLTHGREIKTSKHGECGRAGSQLPPRDDSPAHDEPALDYKRRHRRNERNWGMAHPYQRD